GSSRVPLVRRLLLQRARLPAEPQRWHQADVAVALGAAWWAHRRWCPRPQPELSPRPGSDLQDDDPPKQASQPKQPTALVQCPECGKSVSTKAANCPECGFPLKATRRHIMALVPCLECGKNVSTQATSCPHCGCPLE